MLHVATKMPGKGAGCNGVEGPAPRCVRWGWPCGGGGVAMREVGVAMHAVGVAMREVGVAMHAVGVAMCAVGVAMREMGVAMCEVGVAMRHIVFLWCAFLFVCLPGHAAAPTLRLHVAQKRLHRRGCYLPWRTKRMSPWSCTPLHVPLRSPPAARGLHAECKR